GSQLIIDEYRARYPDLVHIVRSSSNQGLNKNYINTLKRCRGKYIAYLEGDDYWISEFKLQRQVEILQNMPDISLVHTNYTLLDSETGVRREKIISFSGACPRELNSGISSVVAEFEGKMRPVK